MTDLQILDTYGYTMCPARSEFPTLCGVSPCCQTAGSRPKQVVQHRWPRRQPPGQSTAIPKTADGAVEMRRQLQITQDTAVKARTTAMHTLKQIVVHASPVLRAALPRPHRSRPAHALRQTPTGPPRHAHRVRQAYPPGARPPLDGSHRGDGDARPASRAPHDRDIADPSCGLCCNVGRRRLVT